MHRENERRVRVIYSLIGLGAVIIPIFLIAINFQPLGFLIKPRSSSVTTTPYPTPTTDTNKIGIALLTKEEFTALRGNRSYLIIDTRGGNVKNTGSLGLTTEELKTSVNKNSASELQNLFKTQNLILVTSDLVEAKAIATALIGKNFLVAIYFTKEM